MHISEYFKDLKKTKAKTEQDDIIDQFLQELLLEYEFGSKFYIKNEKKIKKKKPTFMQVKMKLYLIRNDKQKLREFFSECKDYKRRNGSFSKCFYGATKIKP